MLKRRDVLKIGTAAAAVSVAGPSLAQGADAAPLFDHDGVVAMARALAAKPYRAPSAPLPDAFANLTYAQYVAIQNRPGAAIWGGDNLGFAIEPLHRGFAFAAPQSVSLVENGRERLLAYDPSKFDLGALKPPASSEDIGFAGFRVLRTREGEPPAEVAIFQGASFFRALARGQVFGTMARGLAIRTADARGEEFPLFTAFWIERPSLAGGVLVVHALLDSQSVAGAYRMTLRAGDATIIDTECTLFARAAVDNFGLGAMAATSLLGSIERGRTEDVRGGAFDAAGLQILNGAGEWIWRPVSNRDTLQISAFLDSKPRGFGFLQRDRDFQRFLDDDHHWERRPSLWIEPIGEWGEGAVTLVEIPSDSDVNQNVVAYWRPKAALAAGSETSFAYRQFWAWAPPQGPNAAMTRLSRVGRPSPPVNSRRRRFLIELLDDAFADPQRRDALSANIAANPGSVVGSRLFFSPERKAARVLFDVDMAGDAPCELRLLLEAAGAPASETWLYRWTP